MKNHGLDKTLTIFLNHLDSINDTLPMVMLLLDPYYKKANYEYNEFVKTNVTELGVEEGKRVIAFQYEQKPQYDILRKNAYVSGLAQKILPESLFVSLISQYDSFLNQLLRCIYSIKPEILNSSQRNLTFSDIVYLGSLENAREFIVEKEVEGVLRENHSIHFDYLETKLGLNLRANLPIWETFIEITERRNLFVHCDGRVSRQYLAVCERNGISIAGICVGERLKVTPQYFLKAYNCLYELSTKLAHTIWRKLLPSDLENADKHLNGICFDLINAGMFGLADILLEFACHQKRFFNDTHYNIFLVNKALSKLLNNNAEEARRIISSKDWSASSDEFKLAYCVIMEEDDKVYDLMKKIGRNGDVSKGDYKVWPLFNFYKRKNAFQECFKEIFNEEFSITDKPLSSIQQLLKNESTNSETPVLTKPRSRRKKGAPKKSQTS